MKKNSRPRRRAAPQAATMADIRELVARAAAEYVMAGGNAALAGALVGRAVDTYAPEKTARPVLVDAPIAYPASATNVRTASTVLASHVEMSCHLASRVCGIVSRLAGPVPEDAAGRGSATAQANGLIHDAMDQAEYAMDAIRRAHRELDRLEGHL